MADELDELLEFLSSDSPQVRGAAVDIVRGLTGDGEGLRALTMRADRALPALLRLLASAGGGAGEAAADSLVNLSQDDALATRLVALGGVAAAMDVMSKRGGEQSSLARSLVMLLVNLTQVESGIAALLQVGDEKVQGLYVAKLVRSFCRSSSESEDEDIFEHVASILVNISKVEAGRRILMEPKRGLLKQIIRQFDSTNQLRKKGVAGTIHNCCFEADTQIQNLLSVAEYLWPAVLLPVAGKKARDGDGKVRGVLLWGRPATEEVLLLRRGWCPAVGEAGDGGSAAAEERTNRRWERRIQRQGWSNRRRERRIWRRGWPNRSPNRSPRARPVASAPSNSAAVSSA